MTNASDLSLLFRIGSAERQLENLEAPDAVLDDILKDIDAVTDDECPRISTEEERCARDS